MVLKGSPSFPARYPCSLFVHQSVASLSEREETQGGTSTALQASELEVTSVESKVTQDILQLASRTAFGLASLGRVRPVKRESPR